MADFNNPSEERLKNILVNHKVVAIVGLSNNPEKDSHHVAKQLKEYGYQIIPVNPKIDEVLGEKAYPNLNEIPQPVDIVDIFRKSEVVEEIVEQAIDIKPKVVWMQEGVFNEAAAQRAMENGMQVVMDRCMKKTYESLVKDN